MTRTLTRGNGHFLLGFCLTLDSIATRAPRARPEGPVRQWQSLVRQGREDVRLCEPPAGSHAVSASTSSARASWGLLGTWPVPDEIRATLRPPRCPTSSAALEVPLGRPGRRRWARLPCGGRWLRAAPWRTRRRGGLHGLLPRCDEARMGLDVFSVAPRRHRPESQNSR